MQAAKTDLQTVLRQGGRSSAGGARPAIRKVLVAGELALATALLIGAGLLMQSLLRLQQVRVGFRPERLLTFQLAPPAARYPGTAKTWAFYKTFLDAVRAVPGVRAAALSSGVPFGAGTYSATPVRPNGASLLAADDALTVDWRLASPDFFRTFGIPLLRGRTFTDADDARAPPVMIISRTMALKFWGTEDVLGHTVHRLGDGKDLTVVGVVGDIRLTALNTDRTIQEGPQFAQTVACLGHVLFAVSTIPGGSTDAPTVYTAEQLRHFVRIVPVQTFADGALYRVTPLPGHQHDNGARPGVPCVAPLPKA